MQGQCVCSVGLVVLGGVMDVDITLAEGALVIDGGGSMKHSSHMLLTF